MVNNFGAIKFEIPVAIKCPCYIEDVPKSPPPWGHWPFELVAVGLDASSSAVFRNDTLGTFGPLLVQTTDGTWHEAVPGIIHCRLLGECLSLLATAESSINLEWNITSKEFRWSGSALDQGVYISTVSDEAVNPPVLPDPSAETYLYIEFRSGYAYVTVYDGGHRALGIDPQSGKKIEDIANSSITHNSSEDLLIVNPTGEYDIVITSAGNTAFELFLSKATNTGSLLGTQRYNGTLNIGFSKALRFSVGDMKLSLQNPGVASDLFPITGIILSLLGFVGVMAAILFFRRKRVDD